MPIKVGPDGIPYEEKTVMHRSDDESVNKHSLLDFGDEQDDSAKSQENMATEFRVEDDKANRQDRPIEPPVPVVEDPLTRIDVGHSKSLNTVDSVDDPMQDPLAGWLVVIEGPGKGRSLCIGYGQNSIGRHDEERICLNFGDLGISRSGHAIVSYDGRGKTFYIQSGTAAKNLVYMDGQPVLSPTRLQPYQYVQMSNTTLCFVPFCGEHFSWEQPSSQLC